MASRYFSTVGVEIYPLNSGEYAFLRECGADFVSVYQETYDTVRYGEVHPCGGKRVFPYRFNSQERALRGGMRGVAFGSLLGLAGDFRRDAFAAGVHALLLQRKYPHAEIAFSFPRLRPLTGGGEPRRRGAGERELLQIMLAYRIAMPFAGITISTRECAGFRDNVLRLAATKISAGVSVGVGGGMRSKKRAAGSLLFPTRAAWPRCGRPSPARACNRCLPTIYGYRGARPLPAGFMKKGSASRP